MIFLVGRFRLTASHARGAVRGGSWCFPTTGGGWRRLGTSRRGVWWTLATGTSHRWLLSEAVMWIKQPGGDGVDSRVSRRLDPKKRGASSRAAGAGTVTMTPWGRVRRRAVGRLARTAPSREPSAAGESGFREGQGGLSDSPYNFAPPCGNVEPSLTLPARRHWSSSAARNRPRYVIVPSLFFFS